MPTKHCVTKNSLVTNLYRSEVKTKTFDSELAPICVSRNVICVSLAEFELWQATYNGFPATSLESELCCTTGGLDRHLYNLNKVLSLRRLGLLEAHHSLPRARSSNYTLPAPSPLDSW